MPIVLHVCTSMTSLRCGFIPFSLCQGDRFPVLCVPGGYTPVVSTLLGVGVAHPEYLYLGARPL